MGQLSDLLPEKTEQGGLLKDLIPNGTAVEYEGDSRPIDPNEASQRAGEVWDLTLEQQIPLRAGDRHLDDVKIVKEKHDSSKFFRETYMLNPVRRTFTPPKESTLDIDPLGVPKEAVKGVARSLQRDFAGGANTMLDWLGQLVQEGAGALDWWTKIGAKNKDQIYNPLAEEILSAGESISNYGKAWRQEWADRAASGWESFDETLKKSDPISYAAGKVSEGLTSSAMSVLAVYLSGGAGSGAIAANTGIQINRGLVALSLFSAAGGFEHAQNEDENFYWSTAHGIADGGIEFGMETSFLAGVGKNAGVLLTGVKEGTEEFFTGMLQNTRAKILENTNKGMTAYDSAREAMVGSLKQSPWEVAAGFIGGVGIAGGSNLVQIVDKSIAKPAVEAKKAPLEPVVAAPVQKAPVTPTEAPPVVAEAPTPVEAVEGKVEGLEILSDKIIDVTTEKAESQIQDKVSQAKSLPKAEQKTIAKQSIAKVNERISFKKPKQTIKQNFKNLLFKTDKAFRDEFAGLRRVVKAADAGPLAPADDPVQLAIAFTQKSSAKTRGFVMEATTDLAGNRKSKGLKDIFKPIVADGGKANFDNFVTYVVAARDLQLQRQGKETGIDPVASRLAFDELNSPQFQQAAREVTEWNQKGIDLLVESGRITTESGEAIKTANPIYVPFFREFTEAEQVPVGKGKKFVPKRLKGSSRKIVDPIEGMIQQMDAIISSAQRAAIERSMANLASDNPEALVDFIKPVKPPVAPTKFTVKEIKAELEDIGIDFSGVADKDLNELLTVFRPSRLPLSQGVIKLTVDGKNKYFKAEKELLDVLEGTEVYKLGPFWDIVVGKPTRLLKLGATGLNTSFGLVRNPIRDIQTFTVTSEFAKAGPLSAVGGILKSVKNDVSSIAENYGFEGIKPDSDVAKFAALGGEMSGFITQDRMGTKHIQHEMLASNGVRYTINTFAHPIDALRSVVGITEIGTRIGEFGPALKEGERLYGKGSLSASIFALNAAQDVTTNFTRHGQIGKQINQIIPFFNAAIQGPDKLVRSFRSRPLKSTAAAVATLTIPALFFWWKNKDKEWYKNMTAHEKASYVHFESPQDEDVVFRFPVPFELGHVFQAIPVAFLDAVHNEDPKEVKSILAATLKSANPLDWPSLIGPVIDIKANEDFAGRPIVSRANEGKLPADQFGTNTTELMKVIGKTINMSPSQIEHLTNSYTGGIYNRTARMLESNDMEKQPADIPVIGTLFTRDPFAPRKQVEAFYNERELLNKKFQSKKITVKEAARRVAINKISPYLSVFFDRIRDAKTINERKKNWKIIGTLTEVMDNLNIEETGTKVFPERKGK